MSRSFGKVFSSSYIGWCVRPNNKEFRARCRQYIQREITNPEYGEVVFPSHKSFLRVQRNKIFNYKNSVRNGYSLEISEILNGIFKGLPYYYDERFFMNEAFIKAFNCIKANTPYKKPRWKFEWLDVKAVKEAIKEWRGDPLEILRYLFHRGYIEQAVRTAFKIFMAK
jgi:hypothetical protein